jgi:steroid delta-isomerase-like uncharacterized protein
MASSEQAKSVLRRLFDDVLTQDKLNLIDELYAEDYEFDAPALAAGSGAAQSGREAFKARVRAFRTAFPDVVYRIVNIVSDGEIVATSFAFSGTHKGTFAGFAPTGRHSTVTGVHFARLVNGKIKKTWAGFTNIGEALAPNK